MKKLFILIVVLCTFSSCMVIGPLVGGKKTTVEKEYVLNSKGSIHQNKSALKEVLYKKGYVKLSETESTIQFKRTSALMGELIMSHTKNIIITANFSNEKILLEIIQSGNFKNGTIKKAKKTFEKIKIDFEKND